MKYEIRLSEKAISNIKQLKKGGEKQTLKKLNILLSELETHPKTGTGKPEQLCGNLSGNWSRRLTKKHRLIYSIEERETIVFVISSYGHYEDK